MQCAVCHVQCAVWCAVCGFQRFDRITREALIQILGTPLNQLQWDQAQLPVTMGGMGLRGAEDHALGAYSSSFLSSQPLCKKMLVHQEEAPTASLP